MTDTRTTTFLLAGHGSRNREGNDEIERFATQWREKHPGWRIEVCFIEHADVERNRDWAILRSKTSIVRVRADKGTLLIELDCPTLDFPTPDCPTPLVH